MSTRETSFPAIHAENVTKHYPSGIQALRGVSFEVPTGSIFGILGPNGAGKTTLLRILTTLANPTSGHIQILGREIQRETLWIREQLGVVSQENHFNTYLSVYENLVLPARMAGMETMDYKRRIMDLLELVKLSDRKFATIDSLSGGMKRRLVLARALLHRPKLLFLDEPTTGLDPEARHELWQYILSLRSEMTIILTTHYMEEADQLSDTLLMLYEGQAVMAGSPKELKQRFTHQNRYEITLATPCAEKIREDLENLHLPTLEIQDPYQLRLTLRSTEDIPQVLERISGEALRNFGAVEANLEEVFLAVAAGQGIKP